MVNTRLWLSVLFGHVAAITLPILVIHALIAHETRKSYDRLALCCGPEMISEKQKLVVNIKAIKTFALVTGILLVAWWPNCILALIFTSVSPVGDMPFAQLLPYPSILPMDRQLQNNAKEEKSL